MYADLGSLSTSAVAGSPGVYFMKLVALPKQVIHVSLDESGRYVRMGVVQRRSLAFALSGFAFYVLGIYMLISTPFLVCIRVHTTVRAVRSLRLQPACLDCVERA